MPNFSKLRAWLAPLRSFLISPTGVFLSAWLVFLSMFWSGVFEIDRDGNLVSHHTIIWADWAAHATMSTALAERGLGIESPFLIDQPFRYPFLINALTARLLPAHWQIQDLVSAMVGLSWLTSLLLLCSLWWWFRTWLGTSKRAIIATTLFLMSGGLGWYFHLKAVLQSLFTSAQQDLISAVGSGTDAFFHPTTSLTYRETDYLYLINVIHGMVIPQRAFALGLSLSLIGLTLCWRWWQKQATEPGLSWSLGMAGVLFGCLPLVHSHSFVAVFLILLGWLITSLLTKDWPSLKGWLMLAAVTGVVAVPTFQVVGFDLISPELSASSHHFLRWQPGWLAPQTPLSWMTFTFRNWGFFLPTALLSFLWMLRSKKRPLRLIATYSWPFWLIFLLANSWSFQPNLWDNSKLFAWVYLGLAGVIAIGLEESVIWAKSSRQPVRQIVLLFISLWFVLLTVSGSLELTRVLQDTSNHYQMASAADVARAAWVRAHTPLDSRWLTGTTHVHWLFTLTGRQTLMAYPGWIWTYGFEYQPVLSDIKTIYAAGPAAQKTQELITKYQLTHLVIGPAEQREFVIHPEWMGTSKAEVGGGDQESSGQKSGDHNSQIDFKKIYQDEDTLILLINQSK